MLDNHKSRLLLASCFRETDFSRPGYSSTSAPCPGPGKGTSSVLLLSECTKRQFELHSRPLSWTSWLQPALKFLRLMDFQRQSNWYRRHCLLQYKRGSSETQQPVKIRIHIKILKSDRLIKQENPKSSPSSTKVQDDGSLVVRSRLARISNNSLRIFQKQKRKTLRRRFYSLHKAINKPDVDFSSKAGKKQQAGISLTKID